MTESVTFEELLARIPGLKLRPGADKIFEVSGLESMGEAAADKISTTASEHGLFAFPPRGDEVTLFRPKRPFTEDNSITIMTIGLD